MLYFTINELIGIRDIINGAGHTQTIFTDNLHIATEGLGEYTGVYADVLQPTYIDNKKLSAYGINPTSNDLIEALENLLYIRLAPELSKLARLLPTLKRKIFGDNALFPSIQYRIEKELPWFRITPDLLTGNFVYCGEFELLGAECVSLSMLGSILNESIPFEWLVANGICNQSLATTDRLVLETTMTFIECW